MRDMGSTAVVSIDPSGVKAEAWNDVFQGSSCLSIPRVSERPCPTRMLKIGPAIVPVIAISPKPFFVMATSADMSPKQLPQASTVSPKRAGGNPEMKPNI